MHCSRRKDMHCSRRKDMHCSGAVIVALVPRSSRMNRMSACGKVRRAMAPHRQVQPFLPVYGFQSRRISSSTDQICVRKPQGFHAARRTADTHCSRGCSACPFRWLQKLNEGRLFGRFFASTRAMLRQIADRLRVRHVVNLTGCPDR
jgi:hypothetical protein